MPKAKSETKATVKVGPASADAAIRAEARAARIAAQGEAQAKAAARLDAIADKKVGYIPNDGKG